RRGCTLTWAISLRGCHPYANWAKRDFISQRARNQLHHKREAMTMDYFEPKSVDEALSLLAKYGEQAKVIAGGTDIMVDIKYKEEPGCLVNIKKIPGLGAIKENGGSLRIGPLATIHEI